MAKLPPGHHLHQRLALDPEDRMDFYELRRFGASYMLNELGLEPWVVAEQLRHSDGGTLVVKLYGHPSRDEAISRIRRAYTSSVAELRGTGQPESSDVRGISGERADGSGSTAGLPVESNPPSPLRKRPADTAGLGSAAAGNLRAKSGCQGSAAEGRGGACERCHRIRGLSGRGNAARSMR